MKTTMGMEKVKVWISEAVGTKIATRLFRGLALGVLLVAATGIYFSINQGEAGSPLASEQGACYPLYPELGPCASEFVAVTPTNADRNDRGLFDEVLPEDLKQGEASSPVSGVQFEEWPEVGFDSVTYHRFMSSLGKVDRMDTSTDMEVFAPGDDLSHFLSSIDLNEVWPEIDSGTPIRHLMKQLEAGSRPRAVDYSLVDWEEMSVDLAEKQAFSSSREESQCYPEIDNQCSLGFNVGALYVAISPEILADLARMYAGLDEMVPTDPALATDSTISGVQFEEWPEVGLDSVTYQRFMAEQGKVGRVNSGKVDVENDDVEAMVIYGYPASIFHALNQGKAGSPSSINGLDEVWPEIEDTPVFHLLNQLKAGSPPSINGIRCYPEDNC